MKLSQWAKKNNITYRTAWSHFKAGKVPGAYRLSSDSGPILVPDDKVFLRKECTITYARVSSSENKTNLIKQSERLVSFCNAKGWGVDEAISEIGSGLNDSRPKLMKILEQAKATRLVVEHKDRLSRFGVNYIKVLCSHIGCELVIINNAECDKEDLMQDFISLVTSFTARVYGLRCSRRKTEQLIREMKNDQVE